jgi:hypothetical protein
MLRQVTLTKLYRRAVSCHVPRHSSKIYNSKTAIVR